MQMEHSPDPNLQKATHDEPRQRKPQLIPFWGDHLPEEALHSLVLTGFEQSDDLRKHLVGFKIRAFLQYLRQDKEYDV